MRSAWCALFYLMLAVTTRGGAADLASTATQTLDPALAARALAMPQAALHTDFHPLVRRPCAFAGYSFANTDELQAMHDNGANFAGLGAIWFPTRSAAEPYGVGATPQGGVVHQLGQTFTAEAPFSRLSVRVPTWDTQHNGCHWSLRALDAQGHPDAAPLAEGTFTEIENNSWPEASVPVQPAGRYLIQLDRPIGNRVGWWSTTGNVYPGGEAWLDSVAVPTLDFQFRIGSGAGPLKDAFAPVEKDAFAVEFGGQVVDAMQRLGIYASLMIGNWNNPGFPIFPPWFYEKYPGTAALDQDGKPLVTGMVGTPVPASTIESAADWSGTTRFIRLMATLYRQAPNLVYYVLGGESMYASYGSANWHDYSADSITHFRRWLQRERYASVAALSAAWGAHYASFDAVEPPRAPSLGTPWLDWLDFRFASMGERIAWHWQAVRGADETTTRPALSCNHGTLYHDQSYARMGADPMIYASRSDGFETGQIMEDSDPDLYNLLYTQSLTSLGKPYCPARLAYRNSTPGARGGAKSFTPAAVRRFGYETLGAGAWHIGFIQWDQPHIPDGEWEMAGTPGADEAGKFFAQLRSLAPDLDGLHAVRPMVGWWLSHQAWALEGFKPEWHEFHVKTVENQIPKLFVYDQQLLNRAADDYPVLVSLANDLVDSRTLEALRGYVQRGGTLVICGKLGAGARPSEWRRPRVIECETVDRVLEELGRLSAPAAGPAAAPVRITGGPMVARPAESLVAANINDSAAELFGGNTLGQTVRLDHTGLSKVAIKMPTFSKTPGHGFHFELRQNDPQGRIIAQRDVPKEIGDNGWVELDVPAAPPAGATVYLGATADPQLGHLSLGWWSAKGDVYAGGTAYAAGQPVAGDRQVKLTYDEPTPAARACEVFCLSDGINHGVILINLAKTPITLSLDLSGAIPGALRDWPYQAGSRLHPDAWQPAAADPSGLTGTVSLGAQDAEFLYISPKVNGTVVGAALEVARSRLARWNALGAATPYAAYAVQSAKTAHAAGRPDKALAWAMNVTRQLGLAVEAPARVNLTGGAEPGAVTVKVFDAAGAPLDGARVWAEATPSAGAALALERVGPGLYRLPLSAANLPRVYDYARQDYGPFHGPLALRLAATAQAGPGQPGAAASQVVHLVVEGAGAPAAKPKP